tara:strand:+ start:78 stop:188 length:111 start_codon:yes stop_codon:yes gene_type:complete
VAWKLFADKKFEEAILKFKELINNKENRVDTWDAIA